MDRNENGEALITHNLCKHCENTFKTLIDEKHDECPVCLAYSNEKYWIRSVISTNIAKQGIKAGIDKLDWLDVEKLVEELEEKGIVSFEGDDDGKN